MSAITNQESLVVAENVGCTYLVGQTKVVALEGATCCVKPGDRIALAGPSGSGKSTLLQIMGGVSESTTGKIEWPLLGGKQQLRPSRIGFIYQTSSLLAPLSVLENVEIPLLLLSEHPESARQAAMKILQRLELANLADRLPEELSGGQAQRIAVARALVVRPPLILADEPTGQLDHATAGHMLDVLEEALQGTETALVVATHDSKVMERMDQVWRMSRGRLEIKTS